MLSTSFWVFVNSFYSIKLDRGWIYLIEFICFETESPVAQAVLELAK